MSLFDEQVSVNGNVFRSEIVGVVKMRVYLLGMFELRLGFNDKVLFESIGREYNQFFYVNKKLICLFLNWFLS